MNPGKRDSTGANRGNGDRRGNLCSLRFLLLKSEQSKITVIRGACFGGSMGPETVSGGQPFTSIPAGISENEAVTQRVAIIKNPSWLPIRLTSRRPSE